jgi:hypothetical protein
VASKPEKIIKDEMRIYALESIVCQLYAVLSRVLPPGFLEQIQKQWIEGAQGKTFGRDDPAFSDLLSGGLEDALRRLVEMQNFYVGLLAPKSGGKPDPNQHG